MFDFIHFEKEIHKELLEYLEYLCETTTDVVVMLSENFQVTYDNLSSLSIDKLKDIVNYYDGLGMSW